VLVDDATTGLTLLEAAAARLDANFFSNWRPLAAIIVLENGFKPPTSSVFQ
jgi:hypothetical protein